MAITRKNYILVAEDDDDDRLLLQTAFNERGYPEKIEFVENGNGLLNYLRSLVQGDIMVDFPAFIMLDLNMPGKDGKDVLAEIKQDKVLKKIPVIVFSAIHAQGEIRRCYELGANTYITKPNTFHGLVTAVDNLRSYWLNIASSPI